MLAISAQVIKTFCSTLAVEYLMHGVLMHAKLEDLNEGFFSLTWNFSSSPKLILDRKKSSQRFKNSLDIFPAINRLFQKHSIMRIIFDFKNLKYHSKLSEHIGVYLFGLVVRLPPFVGRLIYHGNCPRASTAAS